MTTGQLSPFFRICCRFFVKKDFYFLLYSRIIYCKQYDLLTSHQGKCYISFSRNGSAEQNSQNVLTFSTCNKRQHTLPPSSLEPKNEPKTCEGN